MVEKITGGGPATGWNGMLGVVNGLRGQGDGLFQRRREAGGCVPSAHEGVRECLGRLGR